MSILAVRIDSREPAWAKNLTFGGAATTVEALETGDAEVWLDNGQILLIERKTVEDLLGSIKDGRIFEQGRRLAEIRSDQQLSGKKISTFPYVVITGQMTQSMTHRVITERGETQWHWESVNSALLLLQEIGVFISYARDDKDYERSVIALSNRDRTDITVHPARDITLGDKKVEFLMGFPGIGEERANKLMEWAGGDLYAAILGLTDPAIKLPIGKSLQTSIRTFLGLKDNIILDITTTEEL
jgi:ERCC4-type nuclease